MYVTFFFSEERFTSYLVWMILDYNRGVYGLFKDKFGMND